MASQVNSNNQPILKFSKGGQEYVYKLTPTDYLDLLRAVDREGPPKLGVAWTLLQRFSMIYPTYYTLSTFIKAYAQPINPKWFPQGVEHLNKVRRLNGDLAAIAKENEQAAKRVQWANASLDAISSDTKKVVGSIFAGVGSPIPTSTHYAAPMVGPKTSVAAAEKVRSDHARKNGWVAVNYGDPRTNNWFYSEYAILGVKVSALLEAATIAMGALAIIYTTGAGYLLLTLARRVAS